MARKSRAQRWLHECAGCGHPIETRWRFCRRCMGLEGRPRLHVGAGEQVLSVRLGCGHRARVGTVEARVPERAYCPKCRSHWKTRPDTARPPKQHTPKVVEERTEVRDGREFTVKVLRPPVRLRRGARRLRADPRFGRQRRPRPTSEANRDRPRSSPRASRPSYAHGLMPPGSIENGLGLGKPPPRIHSNPRPWARERRAGRDEPRERQAGKARPGQPQSLGADGRTVT